MTAYNLSVCIAPSLLWPKGNPDPLATPPAVVEYMIENCGQVFGEESLMLFGEAMETKLRQDSSTDSDSMHSVLSTHSKSFISKQLRYLILISKKKIPEIL